jgi:phosphoesterase RecJ-like protein
MIGPSSHALFGRLIDGAERLVLTTHIQHDGDALGSQIGLWRYLRALGKQVRIVNQDSTAEILRFIEDPEIEVEAFDAERHEAVLAEADLIVLVDNSAPDRLGRMEPIMRRFADKVLCIDHHPTRDAPWRHEILDVDYCATTVMIYELTRSRGFEPDAVASLALYVGLATDTGFFRFNSTNARAHEVAAELLRAGVDPARVYRAIHERNSEAYTRLLGHALTDLKLESEGRLASVRITGALIERLAAEQVDTSEITTALLAIDGVQVVSLVRELASGRIKVSLRSKGDLDVHLLASEFGGGGHRNASGIVMDGTLIDVDEVVRDRARSLLASSTAG